MKRRIPVLLALAVGAVLSSGALLADDNVAQDGSGVTFMNEGKSAVQIFARYGAEAECSDKAEATKLKIKGGETASVDTGNASLCYCLERPDRLNTCPSGWFKADAGAKLRLR
jgi:hypothetical protein